MGKASGWTQERRDKASERMHRDKPWEKSTGPRTPEGKAVSSRNADKGVDRELCRAWDRATRARFKLLEHLIDRDGIKPFGPSDQVARPPRSAAAEARYEEELARLLAEVERHPSWYDLAQQRLSRPHPGAAGADPGDGADNDPRRSGGAD